MASGCQPPLRLNRPYLQPRREFRVNFRVALTFDGMTFASGRCRTQLRMLIGRRCTVTVNVPNPTSAIPAETMDSNNAALGDHPPVTGAIGCASPGSSLSATPDPWTTVAKDVGSSLTLPQA